MRFVTKVTAVLVLVMALLQAPGDSGFGQVNCGFLTIEQCRATVSGMGGFCVINQFTIRESLPKAPAIDERHAPTRCPTILIRGAPFIRTPVTKHRGHTDE